MEEGCFEAMIAFPSPAGNAGMDDGAGAMPGFGRGSSLPLKLDHSLGSGRADVVGIFDLLPVHHWYVAGWTTPVNTQAS
jgi:hypothetical protein